MLFKKEVSIYRGLGRVKGILLDGQILSNSRKPSLQEKLKAEDRNLEPYKGLKNTGSGSYVAGQKNRRFYHF